MQTVDPLVVTWYPLCRRLGGPQGRSGGVQKISPLWDSILGRRAMVAAAPLLGLRVRILPGHGYLSLVSVVCCRVEVSVTARSFVQRSLIVCVCVLECDQLQQ